MYPLQQLSRGSHGYLQKNLGMIRLTFNINRLANNCCVISSPLSVSDWEAECKASNTHSSRVTLLSVLLALSITFFPVTVEPVKLILSTPG